MDLALHKSDIIIIGAGIIGLSSADALLAADPALKIIIIEASAHAGRGASFANSAMVHSSQAAPWTLPDETAKALGLSPLSTANRSRVMRSNFELAARSALLLRVRLAQLGVPIESESTVKIFQTEDSFSQALDEARALGALGLRYHPLSQKEINAQLRPMDLSAGAIAGAIAYPDDFTARPDLYCAAMLSHLRARGVSIKTGVEIKDIEQSGGAVIALHEVSGRAHSVGNAKVLVCAGAESALAGRGDIFGLRGYSRSYDLSGAPELFAAISQKTVMIAAGHLCLTPLMSGAQKILRLSGGAYPAAHSIDAPEPFARFEALLQRSYPAIAPALKALPFTDWSGVRPWPAHGGPTIGLADLGTMPCRNLFVNYGHGHMGWTMSAGAAQRITQTLLT